jgi:GT2 family glycosyltransferase
VAGTGEGRNVLKVTVAVCTRNRPEMARNCVDRLLRCDPLPDRILVIDQSDGDGTRKLLETAPDPGGRLRVVESGTRGLSRSRNLALAECDTEVIAFTDDDCLPRHGWIGVFRSAFERFPEAAAVTGAVLPEPGSALGEREETVTTWRPPGPRLFRKSTEPSGIGAGLNVAFRRSALLETGGFDERLGAGVDLPACEDSDVIHRLLRSHGPVYYTPDAIVSHDAWRGEREQIATDRGYARGGGGWAALALRTGDPWPAWYMMVRIVKTKWRILLSILRLDPGRAAYHLSLIFCSLGGFGSGLAAPRERSPVLASRLARGGKDR